jgi:hypothetical protein
MNINLELWGSCFYMHLISLSFLFFFFFLGGGGVHKNFRELASLGRD